MFSARQTFGHAFVRKFVAPKLLEINVYSKWRNKYPECIIKFWEFLRDKKRLFKRSVLNNLLKQFLSNVRTQLNRCKYQNMTCFYKREWTLYLYIFYTFQLFPYQEFYLFLKQYLKFKAKYLIIGYEKFVLILKLFSANNFIIIDKSKLCDFIGLFNVI